MLDWLSPKHPHYKITELVTESVTQPPISFALLPTKLTSFAARKTDLRQVSFRAANLTLKTDVKTDFAKLTFGVSFVHY